MVSLQSTTPKGHGPMRILNEPYIHPLGGEVENFFLVNWQYWGKEEEGRDWREEHEGSK